MTEDTRTEQRAMELEKRQLSISADTFPVFASPTVLTEKEPTEKCAHYQSFGDW